MGRPLLTISNLAEYARRYAAGASLRALAAAAGVSAHAMRDHLARAGVLVKRRDTTWAQTTSRPLAERFWEKVDRGSPDGCWLWRGSLSNGYGQIHVPGKRAMVRTHRVSWELHHGAIPRGLWVLHRCDNPPCVNPGHLFLGTRTDNIVDMAKKSRHRRQKIGPQRAAEILREWQAGWWRTRTQIAEAEGVALGTISAILRNKTYRYVPRSTAAA